MLSVWYLEIGKVFQTRIVQNYKFVFYKFLVHCLRSHWGTAWTHHRKIRFWLATRSNRAKSCFPALLWIQFESWISSFSLLEKKSLGEFWDWFGMSSACSNSGPFSRLLGCKQRNIHKGRLEGKVSLWKFHYFVNISNSLLFFVQTNQIQRLEG